MAEDHPPVRMGIAGLGRRGAWHLERCTLRDDVRVTAVYDDPTRTVFAERHGCRRYADWDKFLSDGTMDVVLIAADPERHSDLVPTALAAGKHVIVEPPLAPTAEGAKHLIEAARQSGRLLGVVESRRGDGEFRSALEALRDGRLGTLRAAKLLRWGPALRSNEESATSAFTTVWEFATPLIDQALVLFGAVPVRVSARFYGPQGSEGFTATLEFPEDRLATIDCDLRSHATLQTGWTLIGRAGTWKSGRISSMTNDGEVCEVPTETLPTDPDAWYGAMKQRLVEPGQFLESAHEACAVVRTIEALVQSALSGQQAALGN